jgi:hypothetical protein
MERLNPLSVPELLEMCLGLLQDAHHDLIACALVSRAWAAAAQPHLFRAVSMSSSKELLGPTSRLQTTSLQTSPHLIRYIHRLRIVSDVLCPSDSLSPIWNFPWTHLTYVYIIETFTSLPYALAIQQLLSLPTLQSVRLQLPFGSSEGAVFQRIWERCSPSVVHIRLFYSEAGATQSLYRDKELVTHNVRPKTLRIGCNGSGLTSQNMAPFDFSRLEVLGVYGHTEFLRWQRLVPVLPAILALDITVTVRFSQWIAH